jgi:signal transduction histidine kinase
VTAAYLSGILTAWCFTQLALGAFFALAHLVSRRERDLALFALMCLSLAYHSASSARANLAQTILERYEAVTGVMSAALLATAFNLHFVLAYAGVARRRKIVIVTYVLAFLFEIANATGHWWKLETAEAFPTRVFGGTLLLWHAEPTVFAQIGFTLVAAAFIVAQAVLVHAYRTGKSESLIAFFGGAVLLAAASNDMLLAAKVIRSSFYLAPHAFMLYAFTIVSTLVVRYRRTVGDLVRAEASLHRTMDELRASHAELRRAQDELSTKRELAAVGELAAAIAHEVRNPLAVIVNAVASLRRPQVREGDRQTLLGIVEEEADRLNRLVTDLLRFARPTSLERSRVDLQELLDSLVIPEPSRVEVQYAADAPRELEADPNLLRVALDNLLTNAAQAAPGGGLIEVSVTAAGDGAVRIRIRDHGNGMDAATLARAFDPFFTTRPSGTGLGLPIVQRIVKAHGGSLEIESEPGAGTTATLICPARATGSSPAPAVATAAG